MHKYFSFLKTLPSCWNFLSQHAFIILHNRIPKRILDMFSRHLDMFSSLHLWLRNCSLFHPKETVERCIQRVMYQDAQVRTLLQKQKLEKSNSPKKKISEHISYYKYLCMYYSQKYALLALDNISVLHST